MQAVILAAGRGKRMGELTENMPKPMLKVGGRPILERTIGELPENIDRVVVVIGYLGEKIKEHFGDVHGGKKISYVVQSEPRGPFHALKQADSVLDDEFLVLMADDLYSTEDLRKLTACEKAALVKKIDGEAGRFGSCRIEDGMLKGISEGSTGPINYANCGAYKLTKDFLEENVICGPSGEELLSVMVGNYSKRNAVSAVEAMSWLPIADARDLKIAEKFISIV